MRDSMNRIHPLRVISPGAAVTDNTPWVGQIIDRAGYNSLTYVILTGTEADADATFVVLLEHGDLVGGGDMVAVPDKDLLGLEALAGFQFDDDNETRKLGYVGGKQYTRLTITPAANTGAAYVAAFAQLGHPELFPTPNPPV
jgi:hypothetical protein